MLAQGTSSAGRLAASNRHPGAAAYYGKLPARADFISRRLPRATIEAWDGWLQAGLSRSQKALGAAWQDHYLTMPVWRFALPAGICGPATLAGVLVPSVDAVGRFFPLLIAQEMPATADPIGIATDAAPWFDAAEGRALAALEANFDLAELDRPLPAMVAGTSEFARDPAASHPVGAWIKLPALAALPMVLRQAADLGPCPALWWTSGGTAFQPGLAVTAGLVAPYGFAALLDGDWVRHGWHISGGEVLPKADLDWDRDV
jgi:type VI secretion system protein ImpM